MGTQLVHHVTDLQTMYAMNFLAWLPLDYNNIGNANQQNSAAPEQVYPTCPVFAKLLLTSQAIFGYRELKSFYMTR